MGRMPLREQYHRAVHEFPDAERFFAEVAEASKPGALLLLAEPAGHVNKATFESGIGSGGQERIRSEGATNDSKEPNGITKEGSDNRELTGPKPRI